MSTSWTTWRRWSLFVVGLALVACPFVFTATKAIADMGGCDCDDVENCRQSNDLCVGGCKVAACVTDKGQAKERAYSGEWLTLCGTPGAYKWTKWPLHCWTDTACAFKTYTDYDCVQSPTGSWNCDGNHPGKTCDLCGPFGAADPPKNYEDYLCGDLRTEE
jgi:hypothetical protein